MEYFPRAGTRPHFLTGEETRAYLAETQPDVRRVISELLDEIAPLRPPAGLEADHQLLVDFLEAQGRFRWRSLMPPRPGIWLECRLQPCGPTGSPGNSLTSSPVPGAISSSCISWRHQTADGSCSGVSLLTRACYLAGGEAGFSTRTTSNTYQGDDGGPWATRQWVVSASPSGISIHQVAPAPPKALIRP